MHPKRQARELAVRILFLWDSAGAPDSEAADRVLKLGSDDGAELATVPEAQVRSDALDMARGAWLEREAIDTRLAAHAPQWPPKRQPGVDRAILRLAVWEMTHNQTPPKVAIDEAIEIAKTYSTENSPAFINGVLDAIHKENTSLMSGVLPPT